MSLRSPGLFEPESPDTGNRIRIALQIFSTLRTAMFSPFNNGLFRLGLKDVLFTIVGFSLIAHFIFRRYEPLSIIVQIALLLATPCLLATMLFAHMDAFKAITMTFATYYAALCSSVTLYRLSPFHPLARYPGPIMCKVSKIWVAYVASKGKQHLYIQDLHRRYGDAVRIGPNEISFRNTDVINPLMGSRGLPKGPNWDGRLFQNPMHAMIGIQDPQEHFIRRKPWSRAFNTGSLKELQPLLAARVEQLVESAITQQGVVDLSRWVNFFTFDFMCDMAFGGGSEMIRDKDPGDLLKKLEKKLIVDLWLDHLPWLGPYARVALTVFKVDSEFRDMGVRRIEERRRAGSNRKDLMYFLTNEDNRAERPLSPLKVLEDGLTAIIAGTDTTSSTLCNVFFFLITYPKVHEKLQAEVDCYYPPGEDALDPQHHPKMVYLEAVINETLRIYPVVPSGSQRTTMTGTALGSYFLPEGNQARLHFYSVHRDPRNFSNPDSFWPERWLIAGGNMTSSEELVHNPNAFVPFSHGPSNCVGKPLAMREMRTVICQMVQKVNMRFAPGWNPQDWERDMEDRFTVKKGPLPVIVEKRG